ncbi:MAG: YcxB family protein [Lachnospiraceae bacterium]
MSARLYEQIGEDMITYTMTPGEEDYRFITKIYMKENRAFRTRKKKLLSVCILSLIIMAMSIAGIVGSSHPDKVWTVFLVFGIFTFLYGAYLLLFGAEKQILKSLRDSEKAAGNLERTYTFSEDSVTIHSEKTDSRFSWDMIEDWKEKDHYLYLRYGKSYILLDKDKMEKEDVEEMKRLLVRLKG